MLKTLIIILFFVAISYAAFLQFKSPNIPVVKTISIEQGEISNVINLTGKVINDKTVTLSALVNGQITNMKISKGQVVKKNQILAQFDQREADAELTRLEAEQELTKLKQTLARSTFDRLLNMGSGGVSQQQIDDAQSEWRISTAQLKVNNAALTIARIQREKYDVTAPFSGVIIEKTTEVGQWVEAGTPLFTLVAEQGREIEVNIDSSDRGLIHTGLSATLTSDAWPDQPWTETIHWLAPVVITKNNEALNSFTARLSLGAKAPALILGQQIDVELVIEQKQDASKIPYSVLIETDDVKQLAVVNSNNQIELKTITTGIEDITHIEVLSGIQPDARIAIPLETAFTPGQTVVIE